MLICKIFITFTNVSSEKFDYHVAIHTLYENSTPLLRTQLRKYFSFFVHVWYPSELVIAQQYECIFKQYVFSNERKINTGHKKIEEKKLQNSPNKKNHSFVFSKCPTQYTIGNHHHQSNFSIWRSNSRKAGRTHHKKSYSRS